MNTYLLVLFHRSVETTVGDAAFTAILFLAAGLFFGFALFHRKKKGPPQCPPCHTETIVKGKVDQSFFCTKCATSWRQKWVALKADAVS